MRCSRAAFGLLLMSLCAVMLASCHRGYYRRQADKEAEVLIRQKACDPRWDNIDPSIAINPESRMFDPFSADHPPMPPDDPVSHKYMECVDGKRGYPQWHSNGDTLFVQNPEWVSYLPLNSNGVLEMDMRTAMALALLHSPDYQRAKEELYLSALDVSLERFAFDNQLFAGFDTFFTADGPIRGNGESRSLLELSTGAAGVQLQRLGTTGTTLVVGLANSIMWNFAGPDTQSATSMLDFSLIQPLLRGAGRDVIMEQLTQSERSLLANVRAMERFRQGFYLDITSGQQGAAAVQRAGAFLGLPVGATGFASGYLGLLQTQQNIRIQEFNVQALQNATDQLRAFFEEERLDPLQVRQAESRLYDAQAALLNSKTNYQNQLDQFKGDLGLPPDLPVEISDPFLDHFKLIDDEILIQQYEIYALRADAGAAIIELQELTVDPNAEVKELNWSDQLQQSLAKLRFFVDRIEPIRQEIENVYIPAIHHDLDVLQSVHSDRQASLRGIRDLVQSTDREFEYNVETKLLEQGAIKTREALQQELEGELGALQALEKLKQNSQTLYEKMERALAEGQALPPADLHKLINEEIGLAVPGILTDLVNVILELSLLQAQARTDSIWLPEVDLNPETALAIARQFRLDWMNARAALVDEWRQIEVIADDLESSLDVVFEGDMRNVGDNPFRFRWENGSLRAGFRFDAPIVRMAERNQYRNVLIQYQRARRDYYQFEDEVNRSLREILRSIDLNKIQFELSRERIKIAVQQVELARYRLEEPPEVNLQGTAPAGLPNTTTRDLTDALDALLVAQLDFLDVWVNYEALRQALDSGLGTMQLTRDGFWIDPGVIDANIAERAAVVMGIPTPPLFPLPANVMEELPSVDPGPVLLETPPRDAMPRALNAPNGQP